MGRKKETPVEEVEIVEPIEKQTVEVTPEMLEQISASSQQEVFSYGLGEALFLSEIENRIFYLDDVVSQDTFREVTMFIVKANIQDAGIPIEERMPIKLIINSPGGSVLDGLALIDAINISKTPIFTIGMGYCMSMGFSIMCAGHVRFCLPHSSFLYHDGNTGLMDSTMKFKDAVRFYDRIDEVLDKLIASKTKLTIKELNDRKRQENFWLADEAKDLGVVDYIIGEDVSIEDVFCFEDDDDCDCECCSCDS